MPMRKQSPSAQSARTLRLVSSKPSNNKSGKNPAAMAATAMQITSTSRTEPPPYCSSGFLQMEAFLQVLILAKYKERVTKRQLRGGQDGKIHPAVVLDGQNVDAVFLANVDLFNRPANPVRRQIHLENRMILIESDIIEDMIRTVTNGRPFGKLTLRIDDLVRAVAQKKLRLYIPGRTRDDEFCAQLLEQRRGLQRTLKIVSDGDNAGVKVSNAKRGKELLVRAVADLSARYKGNTSLILSSLASTAMTSWPRSLSSMAMCLPKRPRPISRMDFI